MSQSYLPYHQPSQPLYSPQAIRWLTFLGGPVGITLSLLNAIRAEDPLLRIKSLLCYILWGALVGFFYAGANLFPEYWSILRIVRIGAILGLSYYLEFANHPVVEAHLQMGGRLAPIWIPLLIMLGILLVLAVVVVQSVLREL